MEENASTTTYTKADWLKCDRCQVPMPPEFWSKQRGEDGFIYDDSIQDDTMIGIGQVSDGTNLVFDGGYGMFIDPTSDDARDNYSLTICHECTVLLLDFFPKAIRDRFIAGHPAYKDVPLGERCCPYAWSPSDYDDGPNGVDTGESTGK